MTYQLRVTNGICQAASQLTPNSTKLTKLLIVPLKIVYRSQMPRGKYVNHKGRSRHFTNPDELEEERRRGEEKKKWRQKHCSDESDDDDNDDSDEVAEKDESGSEAGSSDEEDDEETRKNKGVSYLIDIENPNRVQKKNKKLATTTTPVVGGSAQSEPSASAQQGEEGEAVPTSQMTRREREQYEARCAELLYQRRHAAGKTFEAKADLARLALVRQKREEAKKQREIEQKEKEAAAKSKIAQTQKALGKKV